MCETEVYKAAMPLAYLKLSDAIAGGGTTEANGNLIHRKAVCP